MKENKLGKIPKEIKFVTETLEKAGFDAFLIGGCVRDMLLSRIPKDWDITTNAKPEQIEGLFSKTFYENKFGTVSVVDEEAEDERLKVIEVTPYRTESSYGDNRRPDNVEFGETLEEDLKRRDFTMNAIAYNVPKDELIDPYNGQKDLENETIKTVGEPLERFGEDALRILRAIRLSAELNFVIDGETMTAISQKAETLEKISKERIRDEFIRIIDSPNPMTGIAMAQKLGVLKYIVPELEEGVGCEQNGDHIYTVWEHNLRALQHSCDKNFPFYVKLSALFHDIGKPATRRWSKEKNNWTFYGHDVVGGRMTKKVMERLKFPKDDIYKVSILVRNHLFFSDIEKITLSAVRRIIRNVGQDLIWDLMSVRACDRIGMGRPVEEPYRLRKYKVMIEEALRAPVSVGMLKITGDKIMEITGEKPGRKIGDVLHALLGETLDNPDLNTTEHLENRAKELVKLDNAELIKLANEGKNTQDVEEEKELKELKKKYKVD